MSEAVPGLTSGQLLDMVLILMSVGSSFAPRLGLYGKVAHANLSLWAMSSVRLS